MNVEVLDLCAGIGGWMVALRERRLVDLAVENNCHAQGALRANGGSVFHDDMLTLLDDPVRVERLSRLAGAVGSTPCQPFSQANSHGRGVDDPRGHLTLQFGRIARDLRPRFVCLENVSRGTAPAFDEIAAALTDEGYTVEHRVVCAADYGDAQARRRRLLAAVLEGDHLAWPEPTHADPRLAAGRAVIDAGERLPWVTMAEALPHRDDLPEWAHRHPATTIVGSFEPQMVAPPTYRKPGDGPRQNQPGAVETSLEERLLIQGFPRGWRTAGPKSATGLQAGNAIPPTLARVALTAALGGPLRPAT